jgi:DNA-binding NarL/FixJ family response regulator
MPEKALRILIVDDQPNVRHALRNVLASKREWEVCGEASDGQEAIERSQKLCPDVVIMDVSMPRVSGLEATKKIRELCPEVQVLILTFHDFPGLGRLAREAGASGYLLKGHDGDLLVRAIESVSNSQTFFRAGPPLH